MTALRPMAWLAASIKPSLSCLIFGHIMPGVSVMFMVGSKSKRCWLFVTAGSSPTLAIRRLRRAFMSVDFPTLGMPIIIMRSGFKWVPRCGASCRHRPGIFLASPGFLHCSATALVLGWALKWFSQACVVVGSAKSALLSIFKLGR